MARGGRARRARQWEHARARGRRGLFGCGRARCVWHGMGTCLIPSAGAFGGRESKANKHGPWPQQQRHGPTAQQQNFARLLSRISGRPGGHVPVASLYAAARRRAPPRARDAPATLSAALHHAPVALPSRARHPRARPQLPQAALRLMSAQCARASSQRGR